MKNLSLIIVSAIVTTIFTSLIILHNINKGSESIVGSGVEESVYERVLRTGKIRCGYGLWEPAVMRDPNTGQFSGIVYEIMQEVGKALNLEVTYDLEVDWGQIPQSLKSNKVDAHCAGVWAIPLRGKHLAFTSPISFYPAVAFARVDDNRFDHNLDAINAANVTVAIQDDAPSQEIRDRDFPKTQTVSMSQLSPVEELLLLVKEEKADVTFDGAARLKSFNQSHPNTLKIVPSKKALRTYPNTIAVDIGEQKMLHMLNTTIHQLHDNGIIEKIIQKYSTDYPEEYLIKVKRPY